MAEIKVKEYKSNYIAERITEANSLAVERILSAEPVIAGVGTALEVIPGMTPNTVLHAGPPIDWETMCDPMKRAVRGALIFEGLANDDREAEKLITSKNVKLSPYPLLH